METMSDSKLSITFFSNYFNSHQEPVANHLYQMDGISYKFVSLINHFGSVGRHNLDQEYPFVICPYINKGESNRALRHALNDDIVVFGDMAGQEYYVRERAKTGKPFYRYSERLLKRGDWWGYMPPKRWRTWNRFGRYINSPMYILCSSAFTSRDLSRFNFPIDRCYKWGYFPQVGMAPVESRSAMFQRNVRLCSAQRLISLKRVDLQVSAVSVLKQHGYRFTLKIAGDGDCRKELEKKVQDLGLNDMVTFLGGLSHEDTLTLMRESDVFLATSDRNEGWGATVNEAMASGCAVVASDLMGSVPYLIRDGIDGLVFTSGDASSLVIAISCLLQDPNRIIKLSSSGRNRISTLWSAKYAAERFAVTAEALVSGHKIPTYDEGPMSPAGLVEENWHNISTNVGGLSI